MGFKKKQANRKRKCKTGNTINREEKRDWRKKNKCEWREIKCEAFKCVEEKNKNK